MELPMEPYVNLTRILRTGYEFPNNKRPGKFSFFFTFSLLTHAESFYYIDWLF